jgi:methylglutaconyl-CoA hydratase
VSRPPFPRRRESDSARADQTEPEGARRGARDRIVTVTSESRGGACRITLNRPDDGNAFDGTLIRDLTEAIAAAGADPAVRAVVLTGAGRHFSIGADPAALAALAGQGPAERERDMQAAMRLLRVFDRCPKPTVVRVEGSAVGLAVGLVAAADVAIAADDAEFAVPDVRYGLLPAAVAPYVVRAVGAREARRLLLTGDRFKAAEARAAGLVHEAVARAVLDAAVDRTLISLVKGGPEALAATKLAVALSADRPLDVDLLDAVARQAQDLRTGDEAVEGAAALAEGRRPGWI